jgi:hypothetical protein
MIRIAAWVVACAVIGLAAPALAAAPEPRVQGLASLLLQTCLADPSESATEKLALSIGATPYSDARNRHARAQHDTTVTPDVTQPGEAQRTETSTTAFRGWNLPGQGAGQLEYSEGAQSITQIEQASGQPVSPVQAARTRACRVVAAVVNGRAVFETYETLHTQDYGVLVSPDGQHIISFVFDPDRYDIELDIALDTPVPALKAAAGVEDMRRLILTDGGDRFINDVTPGVPTVTLTRAALLAGLDHPATMNFDHMVIEPVVQRIAAAGSSPPAQR